MVSAFFGEVVASSAQHARDVRLTRCYDIEGVILTVANIFF